MIGQIIIEAFVVANSGNIHYGNIKIFKDKIERVTVSLIYIALGLNN